MRRLISGVVPICSFLIVSALRGQAPLTITTNADLGTWPIGQDQIQVNATGGSGSYTWSVTSGSLPPGINVGVLPYNSPAQIGLVGIATTPGNYAFTLTAGDGNTTASRAFTIKITSLTVKDPNLPDAFVNAPYSYALTPLNNAGSATFAVTSPALPAGLTLSPSGLLFGTPTTAGFYNIGFSVTDGVDTTYRGLQFSVYTVRLATSGSLPNATQGVSYSASLTASGGTGGYQYALTGGSLPFGLSLNSGGVISGTTNVGSGVYLFDVSVTDSTNNFYQKTMSIDVAGPIVAQNQITLGPVDDAVVGNAYSWQIPTCCGGTAPFTWSATGLPPGMSIRWGSGVTTGYIAPGWAEIWGLASAAGDFNVTVTVTDSLGASASLTFPLHVSTLNLVPFYNLQGGTLGSPYSTTFQIIGGSAPYSVAQAGGYLPYGLTLNAASAATGNFTVAGTPGENGNFDPVFKVTDGSGHTLTRNNYFGISSAPGGITINNGTDLGSFPLGAFSVQLTACCVSNYVWSVASGSLPAGVTLSPGGLLNGTATTPGVYTFAVEAADGAGVAAPGFRLFTLNVTPIAITTNGLPYGNAGSPYSTSLSSTGGTGNVTWSVAFGYYLPSGLTLASNGTLSGTPAASGQFYFGVTATDQGNHFVTRYYGLNIYAAGEFPPVTAATGSNLGTWHMGTTFVALAASGGNGTYAWTLVSGTLPLGVALRSDVPSFFGANQQAGLIGVATTPGNYSFTLSVASAGRTASRAFDIRISGLDLKDVNPPDAFVGVPFSYSFTPIANAGAVTFTVSNNSTNGAMPPGLSLSTSGVLAGIPSAAGSYQVVMNIFDGVDTVSEFYNFYIYAVNITTPGALPNAAQNGSYSTTLGATGGSGGYTWTVSGGLPFGLTLSSSGTISGAINTSPGNYGFTVTATDTNHASYTKNMAIDVVGSPVVPMRIISFNFNDPTIGNRYGWSPTVCCGGTAPYTWTVTGLPPGLNTEPGSNSSQQYPSTPGSVQIYGVPQQAGTFNVQLKVTDATGASTSITAPMHVSTLDVALTDFSAYNLPAGTINVPYTATFRVLGGSGPYSVTKTISGELPYGLSLNSNTLTVSGTPLENGFSFNAPGLVFLANSTGDTLFRYEPIAINGDSSNIAINPSGYYGNYLGTTPVGAFYSTQLSACCASSYVWGLTAGSTLPLGMSISGSGLLSGTPTVPGTYTFLVKASNSSNKGVKSFTLTVTPIMITTSSLPYGDVGVSYNASLAATGAASALTWTQTFNDDSQLPPGLTLNPNGTITGTPTSAGAYNLDLLATDTSGNIAIRTFTIDIYASGPPPLNLPIGPSLGTFAIGPNQLQVQLSATGGTPPYHYSLTPGIPAIFGLRVQDGQPLPTNFPASITGGLLGFVSPGSYTTSLRVTDSTNATFDRAVSFDVLPIDVLSYNLMPKAVLNTPYSFQFSAYGGSGTYAWGSPKFPSGLTLSPTGLLSGTPTSAGTFSVTQSLTDAAGGGAVIRTETLVVTPFAITDNQVLPQATAQAPYSHQFSAPNCGSNCTWSVVTGSLPSGVTLNSQGLMSGTPTSGLTSQIAFIIQASGSAGTTQKWFGLVVQPTVTQGLSIVTSMGSPSLVQGVLNATALAASGGKPPYTFTLLSGALPPGMSLQGPGETLGDLSPGFGYLIGRPMTTGTYGFTLQVQDSLNNLATRTYSVPVAAMQIVYSSLPVSSLFFSNPLIYNQAYSQPLLVIGGNGNYTSWTNTSTSPFYSGLTLDPASGVVSGTPTATGSQTYPIRVTDSAGNTVIGNVSINASSSASANITLGGPAPGTVVPLGCCFVFGLNPAGGTAPYAIAATTPLPPGFTLLSGNSVTASFGAGTYDLSVAPQSPGTYNFTLQVADSHGLIGARAYQIVVPDFSGSLQSTTFPEASVGVAYSQPILIFDNAGPLSFALAAGSALPPGLTLTGGAIAGTPGAAGTYSFVLNASDASGTLSTTYTLTISPIAITNPLILPSAVAGVPYSYTMTATGGTGLTWSASGLPPGLSISAGGVITGTTTTAPARYVPTITATNGASPYSHLFTLYTTNPNPTIMDFEISATTLPDAVVNQSYSTALSPIGGVAPYTWTVASGSTLPPGLSLATGAQLFGGTPGGTGLQGTPSTAGSYTFSLIATDSAGSQITRTFSLSVTPLSVGFGNPPNSIVGTSYSFQFTPTGGVAPYNFSISPSALNREKLPPGLSMSSGGLISGTPSGTGFFSFILNVQDSASHSYSVTLSMTSTENGLQITNGNLWGPVGTGGEFPVQVTGGSPGATYALSVPSGSLPPGVAIQGSSLTGYFAIAGVYQFTLRATDNSNPARFADRVLTWSVSPMQVVSPLESSFFAPSLPAGQLGSNYTFTFRAAGGTLPYSFGEITFNPLPPGLVLSPAGVLSGIPTQAGSFTIRFIVTDAAGAQHFSVALTLVVTPAGVNPPLNLRSFLQFDTPSVGVPYAAALDRALTGGTVPYTWSGSLPPGMSIVPGANGVSSYLSGVPTAAGSYNFSLTASDATGQTVTLPLSLSVSPVAVWPSALGNLVTGAPVSLQLAASGGTAPYTFQIDSSWEVPPGLTLSPSGLLSGTPTSPGVFTVVVNVSDNGGNTLTKFYELPIDDAAGEVPTIFAATPKPLNVIYQLGSPVPSLSIPVDSTSGSLPFTALTSAGSLTPSSGVTNTSISASLPSGVSSFAPGTYFGLIAVQSSQSVLPGDATPVSVRVVTPSDLIITNTHASSVVQGQAGLAYTVTVTNNGGFPANGTVTVVDTFPTGLTATAISGTGWSCTLATLTCTRADALAAGASYPAITLTVNVAPNAAASLTNTATVSGGGELNTGNDTATDVTLVSVPVCSTSLSGLVGWWPGDGNASDIIGGNNGTVNGTVLFNGAHLVGSGGFQFDGSSFVQIPSSPSLEPSQISVSAWVQATGTPGSNKYILDKGTGPSDASYAFYTGGSGGLTFYVSNGTNFFLSPDAGPGIWNGFHHVAGTFDGATVRLFVDGVEVGNGTPASTAISYAGADRNLYIGTFGGGTSGFFNWPGAIDEVQIFNRALTPSEIQSLYASTSAGSCKPANFALLSGNGQSATVGQQLPNPLVTAIADSNGNPIANAEVTFTVTAGGGTINGSGSTVIVNSDAQGHASVNLTPGPVSGTNTVQATAAAFPNSPLTFTATGIGLTSLAALTSSVNPSGYGQSTTLTASVSPSGATGTVTFKDGSITLGTGALAGGTAAILLSSLSAGSHSLTAVYGGDSGYQGSTSSVVLQTVNPASTITSLTSSPNPSAFGQNVTFTASVSPSGATGTVTFIDGNTPLGTATLAGGTASLSTTALGVATHPITAVYGGDANYTGSSSSSASQVVNQSSTTISLTSSVNPSTFGQSVIFTANVTPPSATGVVMLKEGSTLLGQGSVSGVGSVGFSISTLAIGTHPVTAVYAGDSNDNGSTSSIVNQIVNSAQPAAASVTATTDKTAYSIGQTVRLSGRILAAGGAPVAGAEVIVNLVQNATTRTLSATSAADGTYAVVYQPGASEAGTFQFTTTAASGGSTATAGSSFRVIGLQLNGTATVDLVMGSSTTVPLTILNSGGSLNAINVTFSNNTPASVSGKLTLTGVPSSMAQGASAAFILAVNAASGTPPSSPAVITVTATAIDAATGVSATETALVTVNLHPATSSAVLSPPNATLGVNPGSSSTQQYTVRNDGFIAIADATVVLQSPPTWISLGQNDLGPIAPGGSATFQIIASPPAGLSAGTYPILFTINGGSTPVATALTVNVTGSSTGSAPFNVSDDIGLHVPGATVTLISKADSSVTFQASTDATGNVTLNGVPAGDYYYVAAAPSHDPGVGSVRVSPGGSAQALASAGVMRALAVPTPVSIVLSYNVVTLTFTVTPTTITDVYNTLLFFNYSTAWQKPVLDVIPTTVNCAFYPGATPQTCTQLTITNLHETAAVTDVTVDASQLDLVTPAGQRFQGLICPAGFNPPDSHCTSNPDIGTLSGRLVAGVNSRTVTVYGKVFQPYIQSRALGNINVSGRYEYVDVNNFPAFGTTSTPVPAYYTYPTDVSCDAIYLIHDTSVAADDLRPLDSGFTHSCTDVRPTGTANFVNTSAQPFAGKQLVAFAQTNTTALLSPGTQSDFNDIRANTAFWRTSFTPAKSGFTAFGDQAFYNISQADNLCGLDLISCLKPKLYGSGATISQSTPLWLGFGANWSDRSWTDGYKIPIVIYQPPIPCTANCGGQATPTPVPVPCTLNCGGGPVPICSTCGSVQIAIPITQSFERQAFNATLGIAPLIPLSNVHTSLVIKDSTNQDASGQFTVIVTRDEQGAAAGGTVSGPEQLRWQLIPKAGAGGASGLQYTVAATMNFTLLGQPLSSSTNAVTITVLPQPHLQITYSMPYIAVPHKQAHVGIAIQNTGGGPAHNFSAAAAQPVIVLDHNFIAGRAVDFSITGSSGSADGSTFQQGNTRINFGDIAPSATAAGYFALDVKQRGYIIGASATLKEQDFLGVTLDPLIGTPSVVFVPALGGAVVATLGGTSPPAPGPPNGLIVSAFRNGTVIGSDTTDQFGAWHIPNLAPGAYQLAVATASGTVLASETITVLAGQSTDFADFAVVLPPSGPVNVTVGSSQPGLAFSVDGTGYTSTQNFTWQVGSSHTLTTQLTQQTTPGTQYVFGTWSNGGSSTQTITTPTAPTTYTANFTAQYLLTTSVSPAGSGTINTNPIYYNAGTALSIIASANVGYQFASFSGSVTGSVSPASLTMNGPKSVTANFAPIAPVLTANISARSGTANARLWTITLTNNGIGVGNNTRITGLSVTPTGVPACTTPPVITQPATPISAATPLVVGNIGSVGSTNSSGSATVTIDFSGCQSTSKFNIAVNYSANSGAYTSTATFSNQFR